jgi:hypothetical protein
MSVTRDVYAKRVLRAAEAAFNRDEVPRCPREDCDERLSVVRQNMFSNRSLFCPVHGHLFQEQEMYPFGQLDWEAAESHGFEIDWDEDVEDEEGL